MSNLSAILKVASPVRKRRHDRSPAATEPEVCSDEMERTATSSAAAQEVPPLPDILSQLDRNFETMRLMSLEGLKRNVSSVPSVTDRPDRPAIDKLDLAIVRVEEEMQHFWNELSPLVELPVLRMLQKIHTTVVEVAREAACGDTSPSESARLERLSLMPRALPERLEVGRLAASSSSPAMLGTVPSVSVRSRISAYERASSAPGSASASVINSPASVRGSPAPSRELLASSRVRSGTPQHRPPTPVANGSQVENLPRQSFGMASSSGAPPPPVTWQPRLRHHAASPPPSPHRSAPLPAARSTSGVPTPSTPAQNEDIICSSVSVRERVRSLNSR